MNFSLEKYLRLALEWFSIINLREGSPGSPEQEKTLDEEFKSIEEEMNKIADKLSAKEQNLVNQIMILLLVSEECKK